MNKKWFLTFLLNLQIIPALHSAGILLLSTKLNRKKITDFQQALAHLYAQKPHLIQPQKPLEAPTTSYKPFLWKTLANHVIDTIPLLYFCYGTYGNYTNFKDAQQQFQESFLHQIIFSNFPSLFINTPRNVGFFLQETELLLQAYLLKLFLKMLLFCFG